VTGIHELERGGEPREPSPDDGNLQRSSSLATTASFRGVESRVFSPKTSKPLASIRSSVSRYSEANVPTQRALRRSSYSSNSSPSARCALARSASKAISSRNSGEGASSSTPYAASSSCGR